MDETTACHASEASALIALCQVKYRPEVRRLVAEHGGAVQACRHVGVRWQQYPVEQRGIRTVTHHDAEFPHLLRQIPDPPLVLYLRGSLRVFDQVCVAVVGARRCSARGRERARVIAEGLAVAGLTVVSGLALGIDAAAHRGAQSAGLTIAVLGGGLDRVHPATNDPLARQMLASGSLLMSEYPVGRPPQKHHFPERNRLISGLCAGVVVIEASEKSGSLITARYALEQGRDVMAVPGYVGHHVSAGCHRLIRTGAALVENADHVLEVLGLNQVGIPHAMPDIPQALRPLFDLLSSAPQTLEEIAAALDVASHRLMADLVKLELEGFVQQISEGYIRRPLR
ncbi:MAG: DNA-processing protein DprA [Proteobacteria bacterium]|nr:DNA-processing protein DprA [Pseudomonadota bacterium]